MYRNRVLKNKKLRRGESGRRILLENTDNGLTNCLKILNVEKDDDMEIIIGVGYIL